MDEAIKLWDGSSVMKFHINFDSGMGRIGIRERKELKEFLRSLEGAPFLELEGVYTHFATQMRLRLRILISNITRS